MLVLANTGEGESEYKEEDFSVISEKDLLLFLKKRIGKIEGVVISGGEPTLQLDLKDFIIKIKKMGFKVKVDTNGTNCKVIADLVKNKLIDYVAMDIKAPLEKYSDIVGVKVNINEIKKTIKLLLSGIIPYEFRTTVVPGLHTVDDVIKISEEITGAKKWFLQRFKSDTELVNNVFKNRETFSMAEMKTLVSSVKKNVPNCKLRE
jgi:pyruvate formate lyase activating enzyme